MRTFTTMNLGTERCRTVWHGRGLLARRRSSEDIGRARGGVVTATEAMQNAEFCKPEDSNFKKSYLAPKGGKARELAFAPGGNKYYCGGGPALSSFHSQRSA